MERLWFVYFNEVVSGPFSTQDVEAELAAGRWTPESAMIWWKGQKGWVPLDTWRNHLPDIMIAIHRKPEEITWYAEQNGEQHGPFNLDRMIEFLKKRESLDRIHLWKQGMDRWTNLFEIEDVVSHLGLQRRTSPRAPIVGRVLIESDSNSIDGQICEVSAGGFGIKNGSTLNKNETVTISIDSPLLVTPIKANATVAYVDASGYAGFQFDNLHIESKSTIIDYVRQFYEKTQPAKPQESEAA